MKQKKALWERSPQATYTLSATVELALNQTLGLLPGIPQRDTNSAEKIFLIYLSQLHHLKQHLTQHEADLAQGPANTSSPDEANTWTKLEYEVRAVAERMWRDNFLIDQGTAGTSARDANKHAKQRIKAKDPKGTAEVRWLEFAVRQSHTLLLLWLEVKIFHIRQQVNFAFYRQRNSDNPTQQTIDRIRHEIKAYHKVLHDWNVELRTVFGRNYFVFEQEDAQRLKSVRNESGADHVAMDEVGWIGQASLVGDELHFQYFLALTRVARDHPRQWLNYLGLQVLRCAIGYGVRPKRFAFLSLILLLVFSLLYFFNARLNGVPLNDALSLNQIGSDFYYGLANMISFGSNKVPNGPLVKSVSLIQGLLGYFMLATLAALLIERLTESER